MADACSEARKLYLKMDAAQREQYAIFGIIVGLNFMRRMFAILRGGSSDPDLLQLFKLMDS